MIDLFKARFRWRRRWVRPGSAGIIGAVLLTVGCLSLAQAQSLGAKADPAQEITSIDPPAAPGSTLPALAVEGPTTVIKEHQILMTWLEPAEFGSRLRFARFSAGAWSEPITIAVPVSPVDVTDRPSLTVIDTQAVRRTLVARTGEVVARSGDGGRTWTRLPAPALPFASFAGGDKGGYVFWLALDGDESAKLLGSRILSGETLIDRRVAGRSGVAAAMTWDGPVVAYRDLNVDGSQNIAIVRRQDARWTPPHPVHPEEWRPDRKSSIGPGLAALRRQVVVAWYAEAENGPRVLVAFSSDAARSFGVPVEVAAKEAGHSGSGPLDVALDDSGHAVILWEAATNSNEVTLSLARVSPDGGRGERLVLAKGPTNGMGGVAQIAAAGEHIAVTWMEEGRVRAVAVPRAAISAPSGGRTAPVSSPVGAAQVQRGRGRVGEIVPSVELTSLVGEAVSLASLRGHPVLLNLWATWCLPCLKEIPELAALHERYGREGLLVVGASIDDRDAADKVNQFVAEREIPFAVWRDPEMQLYAALRARSLPVTFVIDRDGRIILRRELAIEAADPQIGEALREALKD